MRLDDLLNCCDEIQDHYEFFEWNKDIYGKWHWIVLGACIDVNYCPFCGNKMPIPNKSLYLEERK